MSKDDYQAIAPDRRSDQLGFRPKRFWTSTAIAETGTGYAIRLDSRPVKTPAGAELIVPGQGLAQHIRFEWDAAGEYVEFADMPLTRLAFTAVDRMPNVIDDTVTEVRRYVDTDLVAYPSEYPAALVEREQMAWRPWLDWAAGEGLVLHQNRTLMHAPQPAETLDRVEELVRAMTPFEQAGLMSAVPLLGSVVLALALWRGRISGAEAFAASRVGEDFQAETWGWDAEAAQRAENMQKQALSLQTWLTDLRNG